MSRRNHLPVVVALLVALEAGAGAEPAGLTRAREAFDANKFPVALVQVRAALRSGDLEGADLAEAHLLAGMIAIVLGDPADRELRIAVAISPDIVLPDGTAPRFATALDAARAYVRERGALRIQVVPRGAGGVVELTNDPLGVVATVSIRAAGGQELEVPAAPEMTFEATSARIVARDRNRNTVREMSFEAPAAAPRGEVRPDRPVVDPRAPSLAWYRRPLVWGISSAVAAALGVSAAIVARDAHAELDMRIADSNSFTFQQAEQSRQDWRDAALTADVAFAFAGAFAIATVVTLVTKPDGGTVVVAPAQSGATVSWQASW